MTSYQTSSPPRPPPYQQPVQYVQVTSEPGKGFAVAALVCGIVGAVFGLIPLTFLFALALGLTAFVLGAIAWVKRGKANLRRVMAGWGVALGGVAVLLGVVGMVIVNNTVNDIDRELNEFDNELNGDYSPPSAHTIDQANNDELWTLWGEAPAGSEAEADIEDELQARGQL
jgi:hypothetical protein